MYHSTVFGWCFLSRTKQKKKTWQGKMFVINIMIRESELPYHKKNKHKLLLPFFCRLIFPAGILYLRNMINIQCCQISGGNLAREKGLVCLHALLNKNCYKRLDMFSNHIFELFNMHSGIQNNVAIPVCAYVQKCKL